ncbi:IS66 family insertion sequence element accessory protein TnpA [Cupriavidus sp. CuC1]|uniref:IS66 family insertion sequence element accessory protein TnpA n=1 Tax=Cupriavidus sp. CuC1 TaxID=3373131 RepID=UPI0037D3E00C
MEFWSAHLESIARESLPISAYAKREGLALHSLYYWRRKLKTQTVSADAAKPSGSAFVALRVAAPAGNNSCTLVLGPGVRLELPALPEPAWLAPPCQYDVHHLSLID